MNYDFTDIELYDAYMEGDDLCIVCCNDYIYFKYTFYKDELKEDPECKIYFNKDLAFLREEFEEGRLGVIMNNKLRISWIEGACSEDELFFGPFMREAENYSLLEKFKFDGGACWSFANNLIRDYFVLVDTPLDFYQLPMSDPRVQHLLQEELDKIDDPLFDIPEIKGLKADK